MDNPPVSVPAPVRPRPSLGKALLLAVGFGVLFAFPLTFLFAWGTGTYISYFRLSYSWGLAGLFVPFAIIFYGFVGNAVLMSLTTFITVERARHPYRTAMLIGLVINVATVLIGWGFNFTMYRSRLGELAAQRNNDRYVQAKGVEDCERLTDVNYWRVCINDKVTTAAARSTCEAQTARFAGQADHPTQECLVEYAIGTGSVADCERVPIDGTAYANQRLCIYDTVQKSWERNTRRTPLTFVEGCTSITNAVERQFCNVVALRELATGDAATTLACQHIDPNVWFDTNANHPDVALVKDRCNITINF